MKENTQNWESPISSGVVYWRLVMEKTKEKWPTDEQFAEGTVRELIDCAFEVTQDLLTKRTEEIVEMAEKHLGTIWVPMADPMYERGYKQSLSDLLEEIKERYG